MGKDCDSYTGKEKRNNCPHTMCRKPEEAAEMAAEAAVKKVFILMEVDIDDIDDLRKFREGLRFAEYMMDLFKKSLIRFVLAIVTVLAGSLVYFLSRG